VGGADGGPTNIASVYVALIREVREKKKKRSRLGERTGNRERKDNGTYRVENNKKGEDGRERARRKGLIPYDWPDR